MYNTKLLNDFYTLLFYTNFKGTSSTTQNMKTDCLFEYDCFEPWLYKLIDTFVDEVSYNVTKDEVLIDIRNCPKFIEDMRVEYQELLELCDEDDYDDDIE